MRSHARNITKRKSIGFCHIKIVGILLLILSSGCSIENLFFTNIEYRKNIDLKGYLMNDIQICDLFHSKEAKQLPYENLQLDKLYLVIMIKNIGNMSAWGELKCKIDNRSINKIHVIHAGPNMPAYINYIIPIHGIILSKKNGFPIIKVEWDKLYCK